MPHNRYFVDAPLEVHASVVVQDAEFHHLAHVLRNKAGDMIQLVNGRGGLGEARIESVGKKEALCCIENVTQEPSAPTRLTLALALPRMASLEWVVEKATELGADALWFFPGMLSEKGELKQTQLERLKLLSIAALKQCGRLSLPTLELKPPLLQWGALQGKVLLADLTPATPYFWELPPTQEPLIWLIGPEKGFHPDEISHAHSCLHATSVRLHRNILRAETAPLVALSLSHIWQPIGK